LRLIEILNPKEEPGKLTLICRFGADKIEKHLPRLLRAVRSGGPQRGVVLRSHARQHHHGGNGYKTRQFDRILSEVTTFFDVHGAEGTHPGGVHVEMTGQNVTECTGGAAKITEADLARQYDTGCDPRLNAAQSLELAFRLAERLQAEKASAEQRRAPRAAE
jgi:3-deoxy-7-phosphoheptulonate synthase